MLVVTTIRLSKGFQAWKDMVHSIENKMEVFHLQLCLKLVRLMSG